MNHKDDYQRLLAKHLARNEEVWPALQNLGISDTTRLQLDFQYRFERGARATLHFVPKSGNRLRRRIAFGL